MAWDQRHLLSIPLPVSPPPSMHAYAAALAAHLQELSTQVLHATKLR
jgi:hypothetical protein